MMTTNRDRMPSDGFGATISSHSLPVDLNRLAAPNALGLASRSRSRWQNNTPLWMTGLIIVIQIISISVLAFVIYNYCIAATLVCHVTGAINASINGRELIFDINKVFNVSLSR
jgi:hypothetical protein